MRVTLNEDKTIKRELMNGEYKVKDISKAEIIELIQQLASVLRYD
ncbi:hypothetical protein [Sinorhizobium meliloti]|nr:hypothetical protein [Sinorhizobium meliloti]